MRIIIAGSRTILDYELLLDAISVSDFSISEVISGGARGVDRLGERWGWSMGVRTTVFKANWDRFGRAAGLYRNSDMAAYAEGAIILWDGWSSGTLDMIDKMRRLGKKCEIWRDNGEYYEWVLY